ncbi:MAG: hypothetical protein ACK4NW_12295 [Roseinatronobacter sp.]
MATQNKGKKGVSRWRAALGKIWPRGLRGSRDQTRGAPLVEDSVHAGDGQAEQALRGSEHDASDRGNVDTNPPSDVYSAGAKGPYLHDTERELYGPDEPPETRQTRSDMRIFFTTALAFIVLLVTIYLHLTEG